MSKKLLSIMSMLVLVVLVIPFAFADDFYPEYTGEPVTLTMWAWTSNENYSIEEFQKVYPDIQVQWENFWCSLYQSSNCDISRFRFTRCFDGRVYFCSPVYGSGSISAHK